MKKWVLIFVGGVVAVAVVALLQAKRMEQGASDVAKAMSDKSGGLSSGGSQSSATADNGDAVPPRDEGVTSKFQQSTDKAELSDPVKSLLLQDGKEHNYAPLLQAIAQLDDNLPDADVAALMDMLAWPNDRFPEKMRPIEINAVKNDVLEKLLKQQTLPEGLGLRIAEMASNPENDPVWREYCVQFMGPCYERLSTESILTTKGTKVTEGHEGKDSVNSKLDRALPITSSAAGGEKNESDVIREALFAALDERGTEMAGTALLGLENLSRTHAEFDRDVIASKAVAIASDGMASTESRMTALRLAASGNLKPETGNLKLATADAARELAQTGETVLMRSAAIVTLGEVGGESDRELLESYAVADNKQIAAAAKMALAKMDSRN